MDEILELVVIVEDQQQTDDFAAFCGISTIRTYHEFSLLEYAIDETHRIFFYLINELSGSSDSVIRQLAPKVPLTVLLVDKAAEFDGSKIATLYRSYIQGFKTPLVIFLKDKDENKQILKENDQITKTGTPILIYMNEVTDFFHKLSGALQQVKLKTIKV